MRRQMVSLKFVATSAPSSFVDETAIAMRVGTG